jgi:hypothetical protein
MEDNPPYVTVTKCPGTRGFIAQMMVYSVVAGDYQARPSFTRHKTKKKALMEAEQWAKNNKMELK